MPILSVVFSPLLPHSASVISRLPDPEGPTNASTAGAVIFSVLDVEAFMICFTKDTNSDMVFTDRSPVILAFQGFRINTGYSALLSKIL